MTQSPRSAACAILWRPPQDVFLVRRSPELLVLGGYHVFPGGHTEEVDGRLAGEARCPPRLVTALRELFEETGVLALPEAQGVDPERLREVRRACLGGDEEAFARLVAEAALPLEGHRYLPMGTWITPPYLPTVYEADYYLVACPPEQAPEVWPGELDHGGWWSVPDALEAHHAGELFISYPVLRTLEVLRAHPGDLPGASAQMAAMSRPHLGGEILRGVEVWPVQTFTLPPATHTNCYILGEAERVVLDPATPVEAEQRRLLEICRGLLGQGARFTEIWLTHHHQDHVGAVNVLSKELGVPVAAHAYTRRALAKEGIEVHRCIEDGEVAVFEHREGPPSRWRAMHTPGHAPGHLCFLEETRGTLISGDNVLGVGTVLVAPPEGDMIQYLESLGRMRQAVTGFLLPAHGPPVATAREKIDAYIRHRLEREASIHRSILAGPKTPEEIAREVYLDIDPRAMGLATLNVQAHLEKLLVEGRAAREGEGFVAR